MKVTILPEHFYRPSAKHTSSVSSRSKPEAAIRRFQDALEWTRGRKPETKLESDKEVTSANANAIYTRKERRRCRHVEAKDADSSPYSTTVVLALKTVGEKGSRQSRSMQEVGYAPCSCEVDLTKPMRSLLVAGWTGSDAFVD